MPKVTPLEFHERDTAAALTMLQQMVNDNRGAGLVFGVAMKRGERPLFCATGRLASNDMEAAGLALKASIQFASALNGSRSG